jgi:hypothetical protein
MLCFESKSFMLSVYMLNVVTLSVFMLNAITLSVFMLGVEVPFLGPPPRVRDTQGAYLKVKFKRKYSNIFLNFC